MLCHTDLESVVPLFWDSRIGDRLKRALWVAWKKEPSNDGSDWKKEELEKKTKWIGSQPSKKGYKRCQKNVWKDHWMGDWSNALADVLIDSWMQTLIDWRMISINKVLELHELFSLYLFVWLFLFDWIQENAVRGGFLQSQFRDIGFAATAIGGRETGCKKCRWGFSKKKESNLIGGI